jgi:ABC-type taurine transport system ATPase subunit
MFLGDVEIHWIHECNEKLLMKKYRERLRISRDLEPVFLWSDPEMFNLHSETERNFLLWKFSSIEQKTLFLTKNLHEAVYLENERVVFIPEWEGKLQTDRYRQNFMNTWYNHPRLAELFKLNMYADHLNNF